MCGAVDGGMSQPFVLLSNNEMRADENHSSTNIFLFTLIKKINIQNVLQKASCVLWKCSIIKYVV